MLNIAWDNVLYYKNLGKSKKAPNTFVFYKDEWDDYGYNLTYTVCFYNQALEETLLGNYRIYNPEIEDKSLPKSISILIDQDLDNDSFYRKDNDGNIESIKDTYYSLAWDINFYQELYKLGAEYYDKYLKVFRDLTVIDLPDDIKENEGVKHALLRNDGITKSAEIIELSQQLKKIDEGLNVGNYISFILERLDDDQLTDEKIELFSKIIKDYDFDYDLSFDSLSKLVRARIEKDHKSNSDKSDELLKLLLDKTDFEQLKSELETIENKELKEISTSVEKIKKELRYTSNDKEFIHYTSLGTLKFLLYKSDGNKKDSNKTDNKEKDSNKSDENINYPRLRLSNARQMNDPNEGYTLFNLIGIEKKGST